MVLFWDGVAKDRLATSVVQRCATTSSVRLQRTILGLWKPRSQHFYEQRSNDTIADTWEKEGASFLLDMDMFPITSADCMTAADESLLRQLREPAIEGAHATGDHDDNNTTDNNSTPIETLETDMDGGMSDEEWDYTLVGMPMPFGRITRAATTTTTPGSMIRTPAANEEAPPNPGATRGDVPVEPELPPPPPAPDPGTVWETPTHIDREYHALRDRMRSQLPLRQVLNETWKLVLTEDDSTMQFKTQTKQLADYIDIPNRE